MTERASGRRAWLLEPSFARRPVAFLFLAAVLVCGAANAAEQTTAGGQEDVPAGGAAPPSSAAGDLDPRAHPQRAVRREV